MINNRNETKTSVWLYLALIIIFGSLSFYLANAIPEGATISGTPIVDIGPNKTAQSRTDPGGRIITLTLDLEQQNYAWKAYVGNVTGTYVLKNSYNYSIYEWPLGSTINGEVYISRNVSVNFTTGAVSCADSAEMVAEQANLGMAVTDSDSINSTFNSSNHTHFDAGYNTFTDNQCRAIALWVNDTQQTPSPSATFQEVALHDGNNFVYASLINNDQTGFDNRTRFDFQAIVAENRSSQTGTPYYFYIELGS
jgi:hypothetical protein